MNNIAYRMGVLMVPKLFLIIGLSILVFIISICEYLQVPEESRREILNIIFNIVFCSFIVFAIRFYPYVFLKSFDFEIEDDRSDMMGQNKAFLFGMYTGWKVAKYQWSFKR